MKSMTQVEVMDLDMRCAAAHYLGEQLKALNALAQRATGFCDREPLPEGDELRSMIAEILFHMN